MDLALICSELPCSSAGVFTTNQVKAAPVLLCRERVKMGYSRAIVANSGNANSCKLPKVPGGIWHCEEYA